MGYFVIIARVLKPSEYGAFVGTAALASALSAFTGWGSGHLLIREITRDPGRFSQSWGFALLAHFVSSILLLGVLFALSPWLLPAAIRWPLLLTVGLSDLLFSRLVDLGSQSFQAVHDGQRMALVASVGSCARLVGACVLVFLPGYKSAATWGVLYLAGSCVSGLYAVFLVTKVVARPAMGFGKLRPQLIDGFHFATSRSAETIYNDIDKTMLARMSTLDATAIYSVAYRFVEAATVPIRALAQATYPHFFEQGAGGVRATYDFAKRVLPKSIAFGIFATVSLFVMAPLLPYLMGSSYRDSARALQWLCPLLLLRSVHSFLLDVLTGADRQSLRSAVQWVVAVVNVVVNLWLIRAYSWRGASAASLLCDALLLVGLQASILWLIRSPRVPAAVLRS